jgi:formamidopyrimidine-DNA glycosylase
VPELPEVETVRRTLSNALKGKRIVSAEFPVDDIVHSKLKPEAMEQAVLGAKVLDVGRKGKYWWLELDRRPWLFGHLGMAGWVRDLDKDSIRLREHGNAPWEDENGRPRFLKMLLEAEDGKRVAMTDGRRLARLWLAESPAHSKNIAALGPDVYADPPTPAELHKNLLKRKAPIKAILLDQSVFAGVGNWIADEVLYHAGVAPARLGSSLTMKETERLAAALHKIVSKAVEVGANKEEFPETWLFHKRWGGDRGHDEIEGETIVRQPIGGRTTAWVPSRQK